MNKFTESEIEVFSIDELRQLGFSYVPGPSLAPDADPLQNELIAESDAAYNAIEKRGSYNDVVLKHTLAHAVRLLNPALPESVLDEALKVVLAIYSPQLVDANETFHRLLTEGVPVTVMKDGQERGERVWLVDFSNPEKNLFFVVNQFTVVEGEQNKRPDLVLYVNGLPLVVIELKNPADPDATVRTAYDQIQTYKATIPSLFFYNAFCVASDGLEARAGTISSAFSRFQTWRTIDGERETASHISQLEVLIKGMLNKATMLDLIRSFIVFEKESRKDVKTGLTQIETIKKLAAYHQYHAVNKAIDNTLTAAAEQGSRKAGVIWHTQGSGKSLSMVFYAGKLIHSLDNPTIVVITDRNDLDQQLFDTFAGSASLLGQAPVQAESREHLKSLLKVASGGIVFTTIQKFFPEGDRASYDRLSDRYNIIVIADEAHRTQYGFQARLLDTKDESGNVKGKQIAYGFAKYLRDAIPNATFIGFTGTPVENEDINTPAIFGNYIDIYDIAQAVADGATVSIYYESRLAKVSMTEAGRQLIEEFEKEMSDDDLPETQKAKVKWTKLESIVGHPERLKNLARDIVTHYEKRAEVLDGKAMIVVMSRRIAVALYDEIIKLRPQWHSEDPDQGVLKIIMTSSSSDKLEFDPEDPDALVIPAYHRTNKEGRRRISDRMKSPEDKLRLVIVRDMWLTGFDAPCLHTLYMDKLMKKHTLMQAIARVNRVYGDDKKGGLIVDYIGIGNALKDAMAFYAGSGGKGKAVETQEKALEMLMEKMEIVRRMFHGFDYMQFFSVGTSGRLSVILQSEEFVLAQPQGKERFIKEASALMKLFALAVPHEEALALSAETAFFQAVRARLLKFNSSSENSGKMNYDSAIRQIVNQAVASTEVLDIFDAAGIKKPDISLLSDEFLQDVRSMKHKNLGFELLKKILNDEIKVRLKFNITEGKKLIDMLDASIKKYQNNLLTTAEIIEELIVLARQIKAVDGMAEKLELTKDEFAFYTALEVNDSAVQVLGEDALKMIACEIADKVRKNVTIDWTMKESARARLMVIVRRTLNKYGYPPDKQEKAVVTVLKQAEVMADYWSDQEND
ncbi:MAG: type I restriction endonuclease subunit R [Dissulfurispiraceae bacterium]|jgi:type I restriction enzyme R subunit|nr:type I restriction endonuclease subunit R [Dissulfurispiraceae bacterium]